MQSHRSREQRRRRLLPAAAPVSVPPRLLHQSRLRLARRGYQGQTGKVGFGIRQNKDGGGNYVPWFNAPPGGRTAWACSTCSAAARADDALHETLQLTNDDRFLELPGYKTFTSHYHMAIAVKAMQERAKGIDRTEPPDYVACSRTWASTWSTSASSTATAIPETPARSGCRRCKAMFDECRRWSDDKLLLMPGEEANVHLGLTQPGKHPGHWMLSFRGPSIGRWSAPPISRSSRKSRPTARSITSATAAT